MFNRLYIICTEIWPLFQPFIQAFQMSLIFTEIWPRLQRRCPLRVTQTADGSHLPLSALLRRPRDAREDESRRGRPRESQ